MTVKYVSGRVKELKVGLTNYSEDKTSLNVTGLSTFKGNVSFGSSALFGDNDKILIGNDNDLQIYHSGTNSFIEDVGTGNLVLKGNRIDLQDTSGNELLLAEGGSYVRLNYNGNTRLETTGAGITVYGNTETQTLNVTGVSTFVGSVGFGTTSTYVDDAAIYFGDDNDLQIYHSGTHSWIEDTGTGNLVLKASRLDIHDHSGNELLVAEGGQYVRLNYNGNTRLETTDVGVAISGIVTATSGIVTYYGDGSKLIGVVGGKFRGYTAGIGTEVSVGVNTTNLDNSALTGAGNSFSGMYISNGMMIYDNELNGNHYIGTAYNGLMAGPVTVNGTLTVDGNYVVV